MSEYIVSARKYRPMSFDSVVGQSSLTTTLKNAVSSGKLAHAYLFCGPRGVGKTTCARIFAKVINCLAPTATGEACGECESCKAFNEQRSLNIFELDAASNNGVEHIKALMEQTRIPPQTGKYKVFIIDEVHMLSTAAFNAFLKTLEEPPAHVIFILATTEKHKILPTIISRCQIYDFERMSVQGIIGHLKHVADSEGIKYEEEALNVIAEKADGGMRDALSIFDQAASFCQGNITYQKVIEDLNVLDTDNYFKIVDLSLDNKVSDVMVVLNGILSHGFDGGHMINGLASHVRNVLMAQNAATVQLIETSDAQRQQYAEQAKRCTPKFLYGALKLLNQCDLSYRQSSNKRLLVELTLIQVAQLTQEEEVPGVGRRPCKSLKSLFEKLVDAVQSTVAVQVAMTEKTTSNAPVVGNNETQNDNAVSAPVPKKPAVKLKLSSVSSSFGNILRGPSNNDDQQETVADLKSVTTESKMFTEDDVRREWLAMCNRMLLNSDYSALAKRMMNVHLSMKGQTIVDAVCENGMLMEDVRRILPRIKLTLAKNLRNNTIDIELRLAEQKEITHRVTPHEFTKMLKDKSKDFAAMLQDLQLEVEL